MCMNNDFYIFSVHFYQSLVDTYKKLTDLLHSVAGFYYNWGHSKVHQPNDVALTAKKQRYRSHENH